MAVESNEANNINHADLCCCYSAAWQFSEVDSGLAAKGSRPAQIPVAGPSQLCFILPSHPTRRRKLNTNYSPPAAAFFSLSVRLKTLFMLAPTTAASSAHHHSSSLSSTTTVCPPRALLGPVCQPFASASTPASS